MRIDELYLQQCLILWLITVQKRANKHKLSAYLMQNQLQK